MAPGHGACAALGFCWKGKHKYRACTTACAQEVELRLEQLPGMRMRGLSPATLVRPCGVQVVQLHLQPLRIDGVEGQCLRIGVAGLIQLFSGGGDVAT